MSRKFALTCDVCGASSVLCATQEHASALYNHGGWINDRKKGKHVCRDCAKTYEVEPKNTARRSLTKDESMMLKRANSLSKSMMAFALKSSGMSVNEIAKLFGVGPSAIRVMLAKADKSIDKFKAGALKID